MRIWHATFSHFQHVCVVKKEYKSFIKIDDKVLFFEFFEQNVFVLFDFKYFDRRRPRHIARINKYLTNMYHMF